MSPKRRIEDLPDEQLIESLLDSQRVLVKAELALELNADQTGRPDEVEIKRVRAEIGIAQDARDVFGNEVLRRLAERSKSQ